MPDRPKSGGRAAAKILVTNVVVLAALLELAGNALCFSRTRRFAWARRSVGAAAGEPSRGLPEDFPARLHPYLGYVYRPSSTFAPGSMYKDFPVEPQRSNNFGFLTPLDYPVLRTAKRELLVGLFGGSVATSLALREGKSGVLARRLASVPAFGGRPILILPFAQPGYKQPQQLLALSYFLSLGQAFDLVIDVDGLNEAVLPRDVNPAAPPGEAPMDITMPARAFYAPLLAVALRSAGDEGDELAYLRTRAARMSAEVEKARTGAGYLLRVLSSTLADRRYKAALSGAEGKSAGSAGVAVSRESLSADAFDEKALRVWADSSMAMQDVLHARGIPFIHVLQPNVFFPVARQHPTARTPPDARLQFVQGVGRCYPRMRGAGTALAARGELFLDATSLFANEPVEKAFIDDCCHLTSEAEDSFLRYIGDFAAARLASPPPR